MKKFFAAVLACATLLMLTGCGRWGIFGNEVDRWLSEDSRSQLAHSYADDSDDYEDYDAPEGGESDSSSGETYTAGLGETMSTCFFDFTVESVQAVQSYDGKTPASGMVFLDAYITIANTYSSDLPMSIYDFQVQWGDFTEDEYGYEAEVFWDDENAMQEHYTLGNGETEYAHVIYEVPADSVDDYYVICYLEEFSDGSTGDLYGVVFDLEDAPSSALAAPSLAGATQA